MKQVLVGAMVAAVVALFVFMLSRLSSDALGMAVGVVFGVLAGIPGALLLLATSKRNQRPYDVDDYKADYHTLDWLDERQGERGRTALGQPFPYQPPVIVLAAPAEQQPQVVNNYTDNRRVTVHPASSVPTIYDRQREIGAQNGYVIQNGVPGKIRSKANGCSFQPLDGQQSGGRVFRVIGESEEWDD